ncbi:hypothetical protein CHARACLAT_006800 [Characodon lateralis]|uniref:phosphatidylinositol-4,5-bisphosphate 3-kinase n=1 Tax=Characodon lateralis TaxID=208331 RepID=A0ABU7ERH3_9TELE|nr:hypothetical protein [Characodon lateralis]
MPPAMTDLLDIWAAHSPLAGHAPDQITVDFLLPTGIYIQMDVPREATIQHIKLLLWKHAQNFPLFPSLGEMESHMFECVNQAAVHEELEDETRRLCDVRPFLPVLKLVTRNCGRAERLLDSKIGVLIGKGLHELDAINDQEVKDFRSKMFRLSEERMQRVQMMTCMEWLQACFSPQLEPAALTTITDGLNDRPADLKVFIHFDQSQDSTSLKVSSSCTPSELMEMAVKKWLITHAPEEEAWRGQYVLRVSQCLEFLCGDHPLIQYKLKEAYSKTVVIRKHFLSSIQMGSYNRLTSSPYRCGYVNWCLDSAESQTPPTGPTAGSEQTDAFPNQSLEPTNSGSIPSHLWSPQEISGEETNTAFNLLHPRKQLTRRKCTKISKTSRHNPENREKANVHHDDSNLTGHDRDSKRSPAAVPNQEEPSHFKDETFLLPRSSPVISRRTKPVSWQEKETSPSNSLSMDLSSASSGSSSFEQRECLTSTGKEDVKPQATFCHQPFQPRVEGKKLCVSTISKLNKILSSQDRANRTPQRSEKEHRGWSLNSCITPDRTGHSSTPDGKDRSCSDILDLPADIFKTSCELDKENAHFVVVDMMLEVLEGVKWTLSFDSMMDKHCSVCTKRQRSSEQPNLTHRQTGQTHKPGQGSNGYSPQLLSCKLRLLVDQTKPLQTDSHCAVSPEHIWGKDNEEPETDDSEPQTKSPSILSTDSGFEDCGVSTVLMPKDLIRKHSAEWLAQQLVLEFKRKWLPSHVLRQGRQSLRSSLQELHWGPAWKRPPCWNTAYLFSTDSSFSCLCWK